MLTAEASRVLGHLASTILRHAGWVENAIIVLNARDVAIQEEEVVLVRVVFVAKALIDLANEVQIAVARGLVSVLPV